MDIYFEIGDFPQAMSTVHRAVMSINRYIAETKPWSLNRSSPELDLTLYLVFECVRVIAILLWPAIPSTMNRLLDCLNVEKTQRTLLNAQIGNRNLLQNLSLTSFTNSNMDSNEYVPLLNSQGFILFPKIKR